MVFQEGKAVTLIQIENKNVSKMSFGTLIREGIAKYYNPFKQGCEKRENWLISYKAQKCNVLNYLFYRAVISCLAKQQNFAFL